MGRHSLGVLLIAPLLTGLGCQDHAWSENHSPVCNETVRTTPQDEAGLMDILFVIDNSGTMREEQESLARNFDSFVQQLVGTGAGDATAMDYQIGVTTTDADTDRGALVTFDGDPRHKIINREDDRGYWTADRIRDVFAENIRQGVQGDSFEKGLEAMRLALSPSSGNQGFLRPNSKLAIVFVTDENDCSHPFCEPTETGCIDGGHQLLECDDREDELTPVAEYFDFLTDIDGAGALDDGLRTPRKLIVAAILGVADDSGQAIPVNSALGPRDYEVACWLFLAGEPSVGGVGGDLDADGTQITFSVPPSEHAFSDADKGRFIRLGQSGDSANPGIWFILSVDPATNSVQLRNDAIFESESGVSWELGDSPGLATEGTRYDELIDLVRGHKGKGLTQTICTVDWDETLEKIGAHLTFNSSYCLNDLPAGLDDPEDFLCPLVDRFVLVQAKDAPGLDYRPVSCADAEHPWVLEAAEDCDSGWQVTFPDATRDDPYPEPGGGVRVYYLSEQGNSVRCWMDQDGS